MKSWTHDTTITLPAPTDDADETEVPVRLHVIGSPGRPERIHWDEHDHPEESAEIELDRFEIGTDTPCPKCTLKASNGMLRLKTCSACRNTGRVIVYREPAPGDAAGPNDAVLIGEVGIWFDNNVDECWESAPGADPDLAREDRDERRK